MDGNLDEYSVLIMNRTAALNEMPRDRGALPDRFDHRERRTRERLDINVEVSLVLTGVAVHTNNAFFENRIRAAEMWRGKVNGWTCITVDAAARDIDETIVATVVSLIFLPEFRIL